MLGLGPARSMRAFTNARYGIMPAWGDRLDPVTIKMLAAYVHSLGGGEAILPDKPAGPSAATETGAPIPVTQNVAP